jgi:pilus assembly protein CpaE
MSQIVIATASADLEKRVRKATDAGCLSLPLGPLPASPAALFAQLETTPSPDVVVLDSGADSTPALQLAHRFDQQCPHISIIVVSELGVEIGLEAMRAGVRDILHPHAEVPDIRRVLDDASEAAQARAVEPESLNVTIAGSVNRGRLISVVAAKGGVGKTVVATNLAVALARTGHNSTVLVDLDVQFGDVASALNLEPEYCLPDAVHGPASRDPMVLKTFLSLHETGLYVICGARSPAEADSVTGHDVSHLLKMLIAEFQYVVVDTAPGLAEHVLAAMDESSDLVLVTGMDVPGVRGLRKELDALTQLGMLVDSRHIVLNFADQRGGLSVSDVEATLGTGVDILLPRSKAALESINQGIPLLQSRRRDPLTKQLQQLAARFTATAQPTAAAQPQGLRERHQVKPAPRGAQPRRAAPPWYRIRRPARA